MKNGKGFVESIVRDVNSPKTLKRKVHFDENQQRALKLHKRSLTEEYIRDLICDNDLQTLDEICNIKITHSEGFRNISKDQDPNSPTIQQFVRERKSKMLSSFNCEAFVSACARGNMEAIDYLTKNFSTPDLYANICNEEFKGFNIYLTRCRLDSDHGIYKSYDFIKMMQLFLGIVKTNEEALNYYIEEIKDDYNARDIMRKDFITALIEAKESGIISDVNIEEIKASYNLVSKDENKESFSFVKKLEKEQNKKELNNIGL